MVSLEIKNDTNSCELVCRVCLTDEGFMESIFSVENKFVSKIMELTNIEVVEFRDLPKHICSSCTSDLISACKFRKRCIKTNDILMKSYTDTLEIDQQTENYYNNFKDIEIEVETKEENIASESTQNFQAIENNVIKLENDNEVIVKSEIEVELDDFVEECNDVSDYNIVNHDSKYASKELKFKKKKKKTDTKDENISKQNTKPPAIRNSNEDESVISKYYNIVKTETTEDDENYNNIFKYPKKIKLQKKGKSKPTKQICQICGIMCLKLDVHMLTHTGEKNHKCPYCPKEFALKGNLVNHINIHTGNKPHKCEICNRSFTEKNSLKAHMITHTKERNFLCKICNKSFGHYSVLVKHHKSHAQERKFACTYCNKAFVFKHGLRKHTRIHTGEKPFECEFCSKTFRSSGNLWSHKKIHSTKENTFEKKCSVCDVIFKNEIALNDHMKHHTINDDVNEEYIIEEEYILEDVDEEGFDEKIIYEEINV